MKKKIIAVISILFSLIIISLLLLHGLSIYLIASATEQFKNTSLFTDRNEVLIDGHTISYREYNQNGDDVLVFVHGFMGSSYDFHLLNQELLNLNPSLRIIAVDLLGFGFSSKPDDFNYARENQAIIVRELLKQLDIDTYHLAGHSMGGEVVIRHTHLYPNNVKSLILISSAGLETRPQNDPLPTWFYSCIFKNYFAQRYGFNSASHVRLSNDLYHPFIIQNSQIPSTTLQQFALASDTTSIIEYLPEITIAVLIVYGDSDSWTPVAFGTQLHDLLENSELTILENIGHLPFLEDPNLLAKVIFDFLANDE